MPPLLRSRGPLCHYCNRWSSSKNKGTRHFRCDNCLAENFLDEHGEIVDVPVEETSSPLPVVRPFAIPLPIDQNFSGTEIFCSTCLKNQHLLTETLANYLPSLDDPTYSQYEAAYPEFRKKLEERYPPVCSRCEPKASQQIRQVGYAAKSDHLRRMMEHSRARAIANRWGWRSLIVTLGAVLFCTSIAGQLLWNLIGLLENPGQRGSKTATSIILRRKQCAAQAFAEYSTDSGCAAAFAPIALFALIAGILASWWNPRWQHKLQGLEGRLVGLGKYYQANVAVMLARIGFYVYIRDSSSASSTQIQQKISHALAGLMTIVAAFYTLTRVKVDIIPLISWQKFPSQLCSQGQFKHPNDSGIAPLPLPSCGSQPQGPSAQKFPISSLAPEPVCHVWQSPTPPSDEDPDAMEWEPSQQFQPNPRLQRIKPVPRQSPFHGTLPAKPTNRLLHPQPQMQSPPKEALGLPPGFFDRRDRLQSEPDHTSLPPMAQPRFFSQGDRDADTGLEALFGTVFSLGEAHALPAQSTSQKAEQKMRAQPEHRPENTFELPASIFKKPYRTPELNVLHASKLVVFAICLLMQYVPRELLPNGLDTRVLALGIAGSLQIFSALAGSRRLSQGLDVSDILWAGTMTAAAAFLCFLHWNHDRDENINQKDDATIMIYLFLCSCWELPRLSCSNMSEPSQKVRRLFSTEESVYENQRPDSTAFEVDDHQPHSLPDARTVWKPSPSKARPSLSQSSRWQPKQPSTPKAARPALASDPLQSYRPRSDSTDSVASQGSATTAATTTTAGWKTPNLRLEHSAEATDHSPSFDIRSLALDDEVATYRRRNHNRFGSRNRRI